MQKVYVMFQDDGNCTEAFKFERSRAATGITLVSSRKLYIGSTISSEIME